MKESGITLVALIITIVILIVLAGIVIISLIDNGMIELSIEGTEKYIVEEERERKLLNDIYDVVKNTMQNIENGTPSEEDNSKPEVLLLFDNGEQYSDITGGWHGGYSDGSTAENGNIDISNLLTINTWGIWTGYTIQTRNSINMSDYSQIVFEIETDTALDTTSWRSANFGITDSNTLANIRTVSTHASYEPTTILSKATYDISNFNGNYYVWFYACNGRKISVSKIYLVR